MTIFLSGSIQPSNDIPVPYYRSVKYDLQLCTLDCVRGRTQLQTAVSVLEYLGPIYSCTVLLVMAK